MGSVVIRAEIDVYKRQHITYAHTQSFRTLVHKVTTDIEAQTEVCLLYTSEYKSEL